MMREPTDAAGMVASVDQADADGVSPEELLGLYLHTPQGHLSGPFLLRLFKARAFGPALAEALVRDAGADSPQWLTRALFEHRLVSKKDGRRSTLGTPESRRHFDEVLGWLIFHHSDPAVVLRALELCASESALQQKADFPNNTVAERIALVSKPYSTKVGFGLISRVQYLMHDSEPLVRVALAGNKSLAAWKVQMTLAHDDEFEVRKAVWSLERRMFAETRAALVEEFGESS